MKTLYLIRHAKSSWSFDQLDDFDRPLGVRGRRDIQSMAGFLSRNEPTPDLIITSPASRTLYTALFIADEWSYPEDEILLEKGFYLSSTEHIIRRIRSLKGADILAIVGHNPCWTDLVNLLGNKEVENLPTCAVAGLRFQIDTWDALEPGDGELFLLKTPKEISKSKK